MFALALGAGLALPAVAWNPLEGIGTGGSNKPFVEPDGYYQVVIPGGFDCTQRRTFLGGSAQRTPDRVLACNGTRGAAASLVFKVRAVPRSATPELVALNEAEAVKKKQEHYKELERRTLQLAGDLDAVMIRYRYNRFGNIKHPMQVVALFATAKGRLFEIRYESREDQLPRYQEDLEQVFASFRPARLDEAGKPIIVIDQAVKKKKKRPTTDEEFVEKNKASEGAKRY
jgi:hypothetical protein